MSDKIRNAQYMGLKRILDGVADIIATLDTEVQVPAMVCHILSSLDDRIAILHSDKHATDVMLEVLSNLRHRCDHSEWPGDDDGET